MNNIDHVFDHLHIEDKREKEEMNNIDHVFNHLQIKGNMITTSMVKTDSSIVTMGKEFKLTYFKEKFEPDFSSYILIESNGEGDNTIYYDPSKERFIKFLYPVANAEYTKRYSQLRREIIIGTFLHTIDPKHFVDIVGYITFDCGAVSKLKVNSLCEGVTSNKISGITYTNFLKLVTPTGFKQFIITFFRLMVKMYSTYKFVHNDLHNGNFFIGLDSSGYYPILLDFGNADIEIPYAKFCSEYPDSRICNLYEKPVENLRISHVDSFTPLITKDFDMLIQRSWDTKVGLRDPVKFFTEYISVYGSLRFSIFDLKLLEQGPRYVKFTELEDKISSIEDFHSYMKSNMDIIHLIATKSKSTEYPHDLEKDVRTLEGVTTSQIENLKRIQKYLESLEDEYINFSNSTPIEDLDFNVFIDYCEQLKI